MLKCEGCRCALPNTTMIESLDGELTEELIEKLQINEKEVEGKIKAYYSVIKNKEAEESIYKDELERLSNRIKTNTNLQPLAKQRPLTSQRNPKLRQRLVDMQP